MAITINRSPVTVDGNYKDEGQYFNQTQFKGLCSNQNVDTIDPSTFSDVENLYIDSDNTLASRPKLKAHDNFGFTSIEKMWIWDDVHLIYGVKNGNPILFDVINNISLDLTEETLNQTIRIENRIFVFLEGKVYVYEKIEGVYSFTEVTSLNVKDYFYIPADKIISQGVEVPGESKNEITEVYKTTVKGADSSSFESYVPNNSVVQFTIDGQDYTITWKTGESYLTLAAPYINKYFDTLKFAENTNGTKTTAVGETQNYLFYSFDGVLWERLPYLNLTGDFLDYFGISKNGNSVWGFSERSATPGLYVISIVADQLDSQDNLIKKYPNWTLLHGDANILPTLEMGNAYFHPSVDMEDWDDWVFAYVKDSENYDREYVVAVGIGDTVLVNSTHLYGDNNPSETPLQDAKVYTTNLGLGNVSKLYFLFFQSMNSTVFLTPFYVNNNSLSPLTGDNNSLFFTNGQGRELGVLFGPLEDMPIVTNYNDNLSHLYVTWIGKYETLDLVVIPNGVEIDFCYCQADLAWNSSTSKIAISYAIQHLTTSDGAAYNPVQETFSRTSTVGVKFVGKNSTTWLSKKGLLHIGNSVTVTWDEHTQHTLRQCKLVLPTIPIYDKPDFSKEYMFYDPWDSSILYNMRADNSVLAFSDVFTAFYVSREDVYANPFKSILTLDVLHTGNLYTGLYPQHNVETDNTQYWSFDQTLYIESRRYTEDFKPLLYFPEINTDIRPRKITNLLVIDRGIVALFNDYEVWYVTKVTLEDSQIGYGYAYYKSRIGLGCKEGADIDIMYDGATITYASPRGIVGMNYQQLTQNTDQILSFLSDSITDAYFPFYEDGKIKIFKYRFWVVFYKENSYKCLILDLRNTSWWVWDSKIEGGLKEIYLYKDEPLLLDANGHLMSLDTTHTGIYKDLDLKTIDWKATSQPLGFGAINNYKRINSININSVQLTKEPFNYILICRNYKNQKNIYAPKVVNFEQEKITVGNYRTFVKRLNYIQSVKFQYTIANNSDLPIQTPISITAISTKYEIKGRVR